MCRCFTSDCPGVRIPGHPPIWCRDHVYVFIVEACENETSGNCLPTWRPDPRGDHDQCSNCVNIQRYIYPEGVRTSTSKRKVHTPRHPAPTYAPPPYIRPPGYEDSELMMAQNSTAAAGPEQPLTHTRSDLTVVPSTPTRRPPFSGILFQPVQTSTASAATRLAEPLAAANFPPPAPETNSRLTGLRPPMMNIATRSAETRLTRAVYPVQAPETNFRQTGLRPPMMNTATRSAEARLTTAAYPLQAPETNARRTGLRRPMMSTATRSAETRLTTTAYPLQAPETNARRTGLRRPMMNTATQSTEPRLTTEVHPTQAAETNLRQTGLRRPMASIATQVAELGSSHGTNIGRTGFWVPTASDTENSTTPGPSGDPGFRPPTRRLFARPGSNDRFVPTAATPTALTGQQRRSPSPPLARILPMVYTGGANMHTHPSTANSQLGPGNSPSTAPSPHAPRTASMFLVPPPRHETRSPPMGVTLSGWDFQEPAPQVNSSSDTGSLYESTRVAQFNRGTYAIDARGGLGNTNVVHQSNIAQASQGSANDAGPPMENQRSSRWRSVREWARGTGESTGRRENEQTRWQQGSFALPEDGSSRSGWHANQQDSTQCRQTLRESVRALRRGPSTWRRLITHSGTALHQSQARFGSLLDPTRTSVAPNDQPTAVMADDTSTNHESVAAASVVRPTTLLSDRTVSEILRRTRDHVPDSSEQPSHTSSESDSITTPSDLGAGGGSSRGHEYVSGNHRSQNGGSGRSSSSGSSSVHEQNDEEELVEIGNAVVRFDAGSQATDWDWNF